MKFEETLSFDDVLLKPKYSTISSRSEVDLSVDTCKGFKFKLPFIPANMKSIVGLDMLRETYRMGMLGIMHRFCPMSEQKEIIQKLEIEFGKDIYNYVGVSVGIKKEDIENLREWSRMGIKILCIDVAHLDSIGGLEMVSYIANNYPKSLLIAGNVASGEAVARVFRAGADICKSGVGSGSICTTRMESGAGNLQMSAIIEAQEIRLAMEKELGRPLLLISDGGHKIRADLVKALCMCDFVMLGSMFAGSDETPSEIIEVDGQKMKTHIGSSTHKESRIEGVKAAVKPKGPVKSVIQKMIEAVQSGCSYQNCRNLKELKKDPTFVRITSAGLRETGIHDVIMVDQ